MKKQKQRLKATQDTLNRRWNKVLDTDKKYSGDGHTKSYPKRKLLPEFDDEDIEPIQPKNKTADQPDQPPRGRDRAANDVALKSAHDLHELLDKKPGMARSIYGSRKHAPAKDHNHQNDHIDRILARNQHRTLHSQVQGCHTPPVLHR